MNNKFLNRYPLSCYTLLIFICLPSFASAAGLVVATTAIEAFQVWLYGILGVGALVYMIYQIIIAMLEKQTWGDVFVAVGKVAAAGGSIVVAQWAWAIWGS